MHCGKKKKSIRTGCALLMACLLAGCTSKAQPLPEGEGITEEIASLQSMPSSDETNLRQMFSITDEPPQTPATEYAYHLEAPEDRPELVKNLIILDGEVPQPLQRRIGRFNKDQKDYYMQYAGKLCGHAACGGSRQTAAGNDTHGGTDPGAAGADAGAL